MAIEILKNPLRGQGLASVVGLVDGEVEENVEAARALYGSCPKAHETELTEHPALAAEVGIEQVWLKREETRMGLGSFKALGATHAIAKLAAQRADAGNPDAMAKALTGFTFICASAGNHGLSMAAGARLFGAGSVVLLSETVPQAFAERLEAKGAKVLRAGRNYEESMEASKEMAADRGWLLLSDGSWQGYSDPARDVMEGYLLMGEEVVRQVSPIGPTHIFLQAGVGGLAAACAVSARRAWGEDVTLIVVEPEAAPALLESVRAGRCVDTQGPVSSMGRLDCKTPSHLALKYLAREADYFVTIDDARVEESVSELEGHGVLTTPSGGAGFAALQHLRMRKEDFLPKQSRALCYISEGRG